MLDASTLRVDLADWVLDPDWRDYARLAARIYEAEGFIDHHLHADRVWTKRPRYWRDQGGKGSASSSLLQKQDDIGVLHDGPAFVGDSLDSGGDLFRRLCEVAELKIAAGERRPHFIVDCTPDIDGRSFRAALAVRARYKEYIDIQVGAYPVYGLKDWGHDRWRHLEELAAQAQFLVALPERDDPKIRKDHPIGYEGHLGVMYELAVRHQIPLQVHVNQTNTPQEDGARRLINCIRAFRAPVRPERRPEVSAVHFLIDCKPEPERVEILCDVKSIEMKIGSCPFAAGSMLQRRDIITPTHSSMAPIRESMLMGIDVWFGTDNTDDHLMPDPIVPLVLREIDEAATLSRFYDDRVPRDQRVFSKAARGEPLTTEDRRRIAENLQADYDRFGMPNPWAQFVP